MGVESYCLHFITDLIRIRFLCPFQNTTLLGRLSLACLGSCRHRASHLHHGELIIQSHKIGLGGAVHSLSFDVGDPGHSERGDSRLKAGG